MTVVNLHSKLTLDNSYKLIQLTPDLLKVIEQNDSNPTNTTGLEFKTLDVTGDHKHKSEVVLCSSDKTWLLRQKNHSNTVLLMKQYEPEEKVIVPEHMLFGCKEQPSLDLMSFSKTTYEYETNLIKGKINLDVIPLYDGDLNFGEDFDKDVKSVHLKTIDELVENSACSKQECLKEWYKIGGCIVNGYICLPSDAFISQALHITLVSVLGGSLDMSKLTLNETYKVVTSDIDDEYNPYTLEVILTVLNKFGTKFTDEDGNEHWEINKETVAKWYGKQALNKYARQHSVAIDEFLINWKSMFPPFFPCDIAISMLRGLIYKPTDDSIHYISRAILPMEPKERFKTLFKLQSTWLLEDIAPFVEELNTRGLKLDSFIMKYARRRRVPVPGDRRKTQIIVSSR
ncbi:sister chromatid cohesion protein Dcc1p [Monosporozyma unispora]|nr:hypothetical protein C6P44_002348 [Kazachstania unispora]